MPANDLLARAEAARPGIAREAEIVAARREGYEDAEHDYGVRDQDAEFCAREYLWPEVRFPNPYTVRVVWRDGKAQAEVVG